MRACLGLPIVMLAASTADAGTVCTYSSSYNDPYFSGPCFVDAVAGCPVHLVLPHQAPPIDVNPVVIRDGQAMNLMASAAVLGSLDEQLQNFDYYSCDCARITDEIQFDEIALTITGARAGDIVDLQGTEITIGPAGTCAAPDWPTEFDVQLGGCDRCPDDPPPGTGSDDSGSGSSHGGCGTTTGASLVPGLLALLALGWRRRR